MSEDRWEVVYHASGELEAELLRGVLEAQEIPVVLSEEGIGRVMGLTVGPSAVVDMLVPASLVDRAAEILHDYESGEAADFDELDAEVSDQAPDEG